MPAVKRILIALALAGCGAHYQTIQLVNKTSRPIQEIYVYPQGSANHGASQGSLAPGASAQVKAKQGHVEVLAVSAKLQLDEHTRDQPSASGTLELVAPAQVVFYDVDSKPPGLNAPNVFGIAFVLPVAKDQAAPESP